METKKQLLLKGIVGVFGVVGALALAGCGGNPYREAGMDSSDLTPGPIPTPTFTIPPVTGPTGPGGSLLPPLSYSFSISRDSTYTTTVNTDNLLKVRIRPDSAGKIGGSPGNFNGTYSCVSYVVTVMGQSTRTAILKAGTGFYCPSSATEQVIDFSGRLTPGHGPVTISVSAANYDFYYGWCLAQPWLYGYNCPSYYQHTVYDARPTVNAWHEVSGTLDIQVNGTSL